jgi:CRP-like cAMP-binding protein
VTRRFVVPVEEHPDEVLFLSEASAGDWARILAHASLWPMHPGDVLVSARDEESEVARFGEEAFEALLAEDPPPAARFALDLGRVAARRLRAAEAARA